MFASRLLAVVGVGCLAAAGGCAAKPKPMPQPAPPSAEAVGEIRTSYQQAFPKARVGVVTAVLADAPYALVGEIDTAGLAEGAVVTFLDGAQTPVANGVVEKVEPTGLTVRFDAEQRPPVAGDVAVKF